MDDKIEEGKLSRGETIAVAIHLGLNKERFTIHEAKSHLKGLLKRLKYEKHVLNG